MGDEKVMTDEFEYEGIFADVIGALDRSRDIVSTASKITDEAAKTALFSGVKIILANCIKAIDERDKNNRIIVNDEDDD